jgi:SSS family solute:Na+ symporter
MFIGTALFVFYKQNPLPPNMRADAVFPYFIMSNLPQGVVGLILAALISSAISSLGSDLNCLGAVGVEDYYKRIFPKHNDDQNLKAGRWIIVFGGIGAILIASLYLMAGDEGVLGIVFTLYSIFSGGIAGMFLLGLFSSRANKQGLLIGVIACVIFTGYALLTSTKVGLGSHKHLLLNLGEYNFSQHKYMLGVYSHIIVIIVGYLASYLYPKQEINQNLLFSGWLATRRKLKANSTI